MQRLAFGSYPEVVTSDRPAQLLRELSADYLWKDVLQTGLVKTPGLIKRLLLLLAHQVGTEVSVNELATQLQMARPTVERYLDLLEQTFVIFRLPSFSTISPQGDSQEPEGFFLGYRYPQCPAERLLDRRIPAGHRQPVGELVHRRGGQTQRPARLPGGAVLLAHAGAVGGGPNRQAGERPAGL